MNYLIGTLPVKRSAVVGGKLLLLDATLLFGLLLYAVLGSLNILLFKDVIIFRTARSANDLRRGLCVVVFGADFYTHGI